MNNNIPFEYVTERDLEAGLAARYNIIYLPYVIALSEQTIESLMDYVREGGILLDDFPVLMLDTYGRLNKQLSPLRKVNNSTIYLYTPRPPSACRRSAGGGTKGELLRISDLAKVPFRGFRGKNTFRSSLTV